MPLGTTTNLIFCGADTDKSPLNTPIMSYPMERIFMRAAFNMHCKTYFPSMLSNSPLEISPLLRLPVKRAVEWVSACGVAQHSEGHNFVRETLNETGINPGPHCTSYGQKQDQKVSADKQRKSTTKFKIRRGQLGLNTFQPTVINQNGEGLSYEHNIDLNLVQEVCTQNNNYEILQKLDQNTCKTEL